jgi:hypothetical protein
MTKSEIDFIVNYVQEKLQLPFKISYVGIFIDEECPVVEIEMEVPQGHVH